jgi:ribulose-phosphate 3-epimerase
MSPKHLVAPSILAADFNHLGQAIALIENSEADWIHCDVMDGHFVPNISFGMPILKSIRPIAKKPLDVHLMISDPDRFLDDFEKLKVDHLTVHVEALTHLDRTLVEIRKKGMKAGVALNPATPVESIQHILPLVDIVLQMTVNPGFGNQKFIPYTLAKITRIRQMLTAAGSEARLQVDGGVNEETAPQLLAAGADVLVAGSHVFKSAKPLETIAGLKAL